MSTSRNFILVALFFAVTAGGIVAARTFAARLESDRLDEARVAMSSEGKLIAALISAQAAQVKDWDLFADEMGERTQARVTLITADGRVIGDSAIAASELGNLENHNDRPEVVVAQKGEVGFSVRASASVGDRLAYVALPLARAPASVVRLSQPISRMSAQALWAEFTIVLAAAIVFLLAALAVVSLDRRRNARLRTLREALKKSPRDARALFQDQSPEAALARTIDDAIARKSAAASSQRDEIDRQRRILESMQEGVLVLDARGFVTLMNRALREMLLLNNTSTGQPLLEVVRNSELHALIARTVEDGSPQASEIETQGIKPRRLLVQASPLGDTSTGIVVVFVDVTEVRRLESLRRDFVANVSHELRTPVTAISSAAETLRSSALSDPKAALMFLDIVDRNAQRLGDLVEDLLDLSRIEGKAYKLALEPLSVAQVAGYCLSLFRERAEKKNLQLLLRVPELLPPVRADRRALEQVLTNLIDNAVKYCPAGREIAIGAEENGQSIKLSVRDTGLGIDDKHLPRLFERFYRVDPGRARETGGTGLGLSIAKHLVEAMGGHIGVDSTLGEGTAFHLSLQKA